MIQLKNNRVYKKNTENKHLNNQNKVVNKKINKTNGKQTTHSTTYIIALNNVGLNN